MKKKLNIIFDLDNTLVKLEGIDFLAQLHGQEQEIAQLTDQAMSGQIALESVFRQRLALVAPTRQDFTKLADRYLAVLTPGASTLIKRLQSAGHRVFVVTGSYLQAVIVVTDALGIPKDQVFANEVFFDANGRYQGINDAIPLWKTQGKQHFVRLIRQQYPGKTIVIGDGMSDWQAGQTAGNFICFAGHVWRKAVIERSAIVYPYSEITAMLPLLEVLSSSLPRKKDQKDHSQKHRHQRVLIRRILEQPLFQLALKHA